MNMRDLLRTFIGPVNIKGYGAGEVIAKEGNTDTVELWIKIDGPRLFLEIQSDNFVSIGESIFTVRNGPELIEIAHLTI